MALSKTFTGKIISDLIRGVVRELGHKVLQDKEVLEYINLAQLLVYKKIDKNKYRTSKSMSISTNEIDLSGETVKEVIKVKDSTNGLYLLESDPQSFELLSCDSNKKGIYYQVVGEKIEIKPQDNTLDSSATVYYERELTPLTDEDDNLDVPDSEVPEVMEIAEKTVRRQLGKVAE